MSWNYKANFPWSFFFFSKTLSLINPKKKHFKERKKTEKEANPI
jgi:hypothetical protein